MRVSEYAEHDALGLGELVRTGSASANELAGAAAEAVKLANPHVNAVIEVFDDRITTPDVASPSGPFAGVPILLKDSGAGEAGRKQEFGSRLAKGRVVRSNSWVTLRLKAAGFNIIGRTTLPEFGQSGNTHSILSGRTRNPWDLERTAGGSSGGSAAAVATGMVPIASGSDGGGSIRCPASSCGIIGLKPSRGRVTIGPQGGESVFGLGVDFALTRSVRDTAALLDAVAAPAPGDPFVIAQPHGPYLDSIGRPPQQLRLGLIEASWTGVTIDAEAVRAVHHAAALCEALGHVVEETGLVVEPAVYARDAWAAHLALSCDRVAEEMSAQVDESTLEPVNLEAYRRGREISAGAILTMLDAWNTIRRQVGELFERYDVLMTPTMNGPAAIGAHGSTNQQISYEEWTDEDAEDFPFTGLFNLTGSPAISLPLCESQAGLPIGVQFAGRFGDESTLLRLAAALEQAQPWQDKRPPVHAVPPSLGSSSRNSP